MLNFTQLKLKLPKVPGVYFMKDKTGEILYVGKAGDLRRRVSSYFERPQDARVSKMLSRVSKIDWQKTETVIEALILEAELIKRHSPPYNIKDKDDKSFLYVVITRETFPRVLMLRYKEAAAFNKPLAKFGPFTSPASLRQALDILRRIFPWSAHDLKARNHNLKIRSAPCFDYQIGLCPGNCIGAITATEYGKSIRQLIKFFRGQKKNLIKELKMEMSRAVNDLNFEKAARLRKKIDSLGHIQDVALITKDEPSSKNQFRRIEGYDISNISGASAVGAMVVFANGIPDKSQYRKFKIKTVKGANDTGMLAEILRRRFNHPEWSFPDVVLVDGGITQVNAARNVMKELKLEIPVIGIAKGKERKRNDFLYPLGMHKAVFETRDALIKVRDEAHRFAVKYHRKLREKL
jgi:excinuclease ABC subunit C